MDIEEQRFIKSTSGFIVNQLANNGPMSFSELADKAITDNISLKYLKLSGWYLVEQGQADFDEKHRLMLV